MLSFLVAVRRQLLSGLSSQSLFSLPCQSLSGLSSQSLSSSPCRQSLSGLSCQSLSAVSRCPPSVAVQFVLSVAVQFVSQSLSAVSRCPVCRVGPSRVLFRRLWVSSPPSSSARRPPSSYVSAVRRPVTSPPSSGAITGGDRCQPGGACRHTVPCVSNRRRSMLTRHASKAASMGEPRRPTPGSEYK